MISRWEELRLITLCVTTDNRHAFEQLIVAHEDALRRFIFNLTLCNAALTDDIMQETFLKAYLSLSSFRGLSRFKTWLFRIAVNEYNLYLRRHTEYQLDNDSDRNRELKSVYKPTDAIDASLDVYRCLSILKPDERMAIELFYMEDLPIKKISEIMSMPEGTVKSHLSRAKTKMADVFNSDSI